MSKQTVLVVDDERDIRELLTITLGRMNLLVDSAGSVGDAKRLLAEHRYDLCFTDMRLPDGSGQELLELIAAEYAEMPVAMITAYGNVDAAVNALKAGAFDFVSKPVDINMLRRLVQTALRLGQQRREQGENIAPGNDAASGETGSASRLIGASPAIEQVRATIAKLARNQAPVYISGESGVGKELVARLIHDQGPRGGGAFVPVNCGAIPGELMESEFFGHKKGSFTGANVDKEGLFQAAHGGTLFLDEVADLPMHMQVKLLRVIQEKAVRPIGAHAEIPVDVRILSATHKDLARLVERGQFRQDLFYRINVIELRVPPLRERREDVPRLTARILERLAADNGMDAPPRLQPEALRALLDYAFPGNVRELENILERAVALCDNGSIERSDLMLMPAGTPANGGAGSAAIDPATAAADPGPQSLDDMITGLEREKIMQTLQKTRYNKTAAARELGITFRALRYKLKKLGID
ncbi:MAG: sigma-54 dependent transcriptional regulator [Metallibacterium scheffleri]|jgi:two-component system response regulator PilR (NtrC family)|uniref:sigma-54-dependent transcriptional regulator n=1 Tax=Metallibacterium scheffleri TaxID=993689 RepID=UPI0026EF8E8D|nr:sigma-54 dependent transcriptional regulator [Metallibacterium scheffleri]MCK9366279.1 sigma-54 dependent transcriptional regulator [Metallibacterium scheffleri]